MHRIIALAAAGLLAPAASADLVEHTFVITLEHSLIGARLAIPPSITALEVTAPNQRDTENPLYQSGTVTNQNPIYDQAAAPGTPGSVASFTFEIYAVFSSHHDGIVHRDIATRNHLITTNEGEYAGDPDVPGLWGNDGGDQIFGVGPVRWMAPESIEHRQYSSRGAITGYWSIAAFSYIEVSYPAIPAPGALLALAPLAGVRRRR